MALLHHHPLDPHARFVRLALAEMGVRHELVDEKPWERSEALLRLNPAGTLPVFIDDSGLVVPCATVIVEYLDERLGLGLGDRRLTADTPEGRVEVRRLVDWFLVKFHAEVTDYLITEKVTKRFITADAGGGPPDTTAIRAAKTNVRYHLRYIGFLIRKRNWLAGDRLSFADLAAAAMLSVVDYLGDVPWDEDEMAKDWYARVKSRPAFRPLLTDTIRGVVPSETYVNLDF
ncbi:MAG: glutathione S-transferase family protein [Labrys sp. (in: a-proteobacteria)]